MANLETTMRVVRYTTCVAVAFMLVACSYVAPPTKNVIDAAINQALGGQRAIGQTGSDVPYPCVGHLRVVKSWPPTRKADEDGEPAYEVKFTRELADVPKWAETQVAVGEAGRPKSKAFTATLKRSGSGWAAEVDDSGCHAK